MSEFRASPRFELRRWLGAGGMGMVHHAYDREREEEVAIKTLRRLSGPGIYQLKQEFRALADVSHPNLVALYELHSSGDDWFFTMELVDGVDFLTWVRVGEPDAAPDTIPDISATLPGTPDADAADPPGARRRPGPPADPLRLRDALRQLCEAVAALHAAGLLHRDLKPPNVLVSSDGRVVVLDFGLAAAAVAAAEDTDSPVAGTPAYMAPEQAAGLAAVPASDWYGVGVMLYEALTGELPFRGTRLEIMADKQQFEPPPPEQLAPDAPADLATLCMELLRRAPESRPGGREILRRVGAVAADAAALGSSTPSSLGAPLVGREAELAALHDARAAVRPGRAVIVRLRGSPGMGKSALLRRFQDETRRDENALVVSGRCHERELVPYRAVDDLVDGLTRHLARLPGVEAEALLPREIGALARIFPAVARIEAVARRPREGADAPDPHELRRRAFAALRQLLGRLGAARRLVLILDDVQWGDTDGAALLVEVLRPPEPPPLLLVAAHRSEDETSPLVAALRELPPSVELEVRDLEVGPLAAGDAEALARSLLGADAPQAAVIARESGGQPLLLDALVRHARTGPAGPAPLGLEQMLRARADRLGDDARRLLEVVALAGLPINVEVAVRAADLRGDTRTALAALRAATLVRSSSAGLEAYHDRVREVVVAGLAEDVRREHHRRLAVVLSAAGTVEPEVLIPHLVGAGWAERAAEAAQAAAERAERALAFDRAAALYRLALHHGARAEPGIAGLHARLGDSLAHAGRGAEAAEAYDRAAEGAPAAEYLELRRRAGEQLLRCGHIDAGMTRIEQVMAAIGMRRASTPRRAVLSLLLGRARLRLRGLGFTERDASQLSAEELTRIDTCWAVGAGLALVDTIRAADFQTQHLRLALRAGEPRRIARGLAAEAGLRMLSGVRGIDARRRLMADARALAERLDDPYGLGLSWMLEGIDEFTIGRFPDALELLERAETIFRDRCVGAVWEIDSVRTFNLATLAYLGELALLSRRARDWVRDAQARGDLYGQASLCNGVTILLWLAEDDPDSGRAALAEMMARWSPHGFHLQHFMELLAASLLDLYQGRGGAALRRWDLAWPALASSMLLRSQSVRIDCIEQRARCRLAVAASMPDREPLLRQIERDARSLARERAGWATAKAQLLLAQCAALRGDRDRADSLLAGSAAALDALDMRLFASAARWRRGQLLGGDQGRALVAAAEDRLAAQLVRAPARLAAVFAPGWPPSAKCSS